MGKGAQRFNSLKEGHKKVFSGHSEILNRFDRIHSHNINYNYWYALLVLISILLSPLVLHP